MPLMWVRKCERCCCLGATYFPLFFVYSLTTWALWVIIKIGFVYTKTSWAGIGTSGLGIILHLLLNWSYTTAVFTNPGTTTSKNGYSSLAMQTSSVGSNFTVKANGELRYCKKCQARKPDRAHHCSTCRVCVLKMDHHCPWLATCVGLRNYKAFLLFLGYTTLFCFICFGISGFWIWKEISNEYSYTQSLMPINYVVLAVISSIIGLILAGFTGWHILLASRGQTTIECLEKTRYLSSIRRIGARYQATPAEHDRYAINVNADAAGTSRLVQKSDTSKINAGERAYHNEYERSRAQHQYQDYLDEQDSIKLPSAFDLGWKMNFLNLFGPNKLLWFIPVLTTVGDGWNWEPNPKWLIARQKIMHEREEQSQREQVTGWGSVTLNPSATKAHNDTLQDDRSLKFGRKIDSLETHGQSKFQADKTLGKALEYNDGVLLCNLRPRTSGD